MASPLFVAVPNACSSTNDQTFIFGAVCPFCPAYSFQNMTLYFSSFCLLAADDFRRQETQSEGAGVFFRSGDGVGGQT